jgi:hypothetical protein
MPLVTGSAIGNVDAQEDIFLEGSPTIYFQDSRATPLFNPDADGFYWGLSGTTAYPVYEIGCPTDVTFTENLTINDVLCDNVGVKATIQQRNYFEFQFSIQSLFPLQVLTNLLNGGTVTENTTTHKQLMPLGKINNDQFWHLYAPKVYNETDGDYVWIYMHKAQYMDAFSIAMTFGVPWKLTGLKLRAVVDSTKPAAQQFGMWGRSDASVIV